MVTDDNPPSLPTGLTSELKLAIYSFCERHGIAPQSSLAYIVAQAFAKGADIGLRWAESWREE